MNVPKPFQIQIRFADIDLMGHVNNAIYLSYFEMTRVHYFEQLLGKLWDYQQYGFLLARNEIDYMKPILLYDEPIITMTLHKIGTKSFSLSYTIEVAGELRTKGLSVMVGYDSQSHQTIAIPTKMREALERLGVE